MRLTCYVTLVLWFQASYQAGLVCPRAEPCIETNRILPPTANSLETRQKAGKVTLATAGFSNVILVKNAIESLNQDQSVASGSAPSSSRRFPQSRTFCSSHPSSCFDDILCYRELTVPTAAAV